MVAHQRQVLMTALRITGNMQDAQGASQEVFFRLFRHQARLDPDREVGPWLYRVTVNVCLDLLRKRPHLGLESAPEPRDANPGPEAAMDLDGRRSLLHRALQRLPEKERAALVLREIEGLSTREVAEALGSSETTVRSQISTARARLREICTGLMQRRRT